MLVDAAISARGPAELQSRCDLAAGRTALAQSDPVRLGLFQLRLVRLPDLDGLLVDLAAAREDQLSSDPCLLPSPRNARCPGVVRVQARPTRGTGGTPGALW